MFSFKSSHLALFIFFAFFSLNSWSQTNNPLINSGVILTNGSKLQEGKKFKEAIEEFKKIDRNDTNYVTALYELAYSYYYDSQYNMALENARLGLSLFPQKNTLYSGIAANTLDMLKKHNEAISLYDSAIKRNLHEHTLFFNRGIFNFNLKNYADAKKDMQQCLLIYPYYASAHYFLGLIYLYEDNLNPGNFSVFVEFIIPFIAIFKPAF